MNHSNILPYQFNMSLGFTPTIIAILLCEWLSPDVSIYIGTGIGVLSSIYFIIFGKRHVPRILLHSTTVMLCLLTLSTFFLDRYCPVSLVPLTLEISTMIPPMLFLANRKKLSKPIRTHQQSAKLHHLIQSIEASIATSKVIMILGFIHFLLVSTSILISYPLSSSNFYILFHIFPTAVFVTSILFNQFGIYYFNRTINHNIIVPIVNKQGDVIGKRIATDTIYGNAQYITPIIRIAITAHGMLYLRPRIYKNDYEQGKSDLPIEGYLIYGESLEQGVSRLIRPLFPNISPENIRFNLKYHYKKQYINRLVYLFLLDLNNENQHTCLPDSKDFKLWTFRQIEHNLGKHFFSNYFEYEYEYLKTIIYTREKYKES